MDFGFTEELELLRQTVRKYAKTELLPGYQERERAGVLPVDKRKQMANMGLMGLRIAQCYGGSDVDYITLGIVVEEIARGDFVLSSVVTSNGFSGEIIDGYASETIKQRWLPALASGEATIGISLSEPHCGSDAIALTTRAERDGDEYVLSGEKTSLSMVDAEAALVFARTGGPGARGITCFLLPRDTPGVGRSYFNDLGCRSVRRGSLHLDNARIPLDHRIGDEGQGFYTVMSGFDYARSLLALSCIGATAQTVDETIEYVKTRTAFGQPIARFQGVSFPIAEALTLLDTARFLCYRALWLRQEKRPNTSEAAMAKWYGPKVCIDVLHQMLLLHGHAGYSDDYPVGQRLRDVIGFEIGDGTAEISKLIICREAIGRAFAPS